MKMRPIHRPPRVPEGRYPHCRWKVFIDEASNPYEQHENLERIKTTRLAGIPIDIPDTDAEPGGWADYSGPFDPGAQLEDFSHRALLKINQEAAVQAHLLVRAYLLCVASRHGDADALELGTMQWTGSAALAARRIGRCLEIEGDGIDSIAKVFQMHPHFHPRSYVDFRVEVTGPESARISMRDSPAFEEGDPYSWFAQLGREAHPALDAICEAVNPYARCHPVANPTDARLAWDIVIDRSSDPQEETSLMNLARLSRGANFELMQRRPLRN